MPMSTPCRDLRMGHLQAARWISADTCFPRRNSRRCWTGARTKCQASTPSVKSRPSVRTNPTLTREANNNPP
eukprot:5005057-Alexandrium_andersonii.AAC.1